jgi:hypothetical protein
MDNIIAARSKIGEGIQLITERQKLLKIADSSPLRWKVVAEYQSNRIADVSEDEKRKRKTNCSGWGINQTANQDLTPTRLKELNHNPKSQGHVSDVGLMVTGQKIAERKSVNQRWVFLTMIHSESFMQSDRENYSNMFSSSFATDQCSQPVSPVGRLNSNLPVWAPVWANTGVDNYIKGHRKHKMNVYMSILLQNMCPRDQIRINW